MSALRRIRFPASIGERRVGRDIEDVLVRVRAFMCMSMSHAHGVRERLRA